ncbi:YycH family regulatory protein [Paenibacillus segetis]|uniref:Regulatory protein YycH domain-containing protein n=1 Tax=Paenibacillus segetis TaxID=1325360 RepID=A0ABQ1YLS5_9BACL|nr:two-component system activity regulator YycH [Paenibacillus segetis]GGH30119.1 hypothetical protein GCM10008013_33010 [Paenibacillus segetis]
MKETIKSLFLTLLVVVSMVQSYYLIYRLPGSDPIVKSENEYIVAESMGTQLEVESMIFPAQILIHMGDDRHSVFYPESTFYNLIYSRLGGRQFGGFQRYSLENINWTDIRRRHEGIELKFENSVPVTLLQKAMQISPDPLFDAESIDRILIYNTENEDQVRVFFFSSDGNVVYEATKVDLTVQDVKQQINFGEEWVPYTLVDGYYIPEKSIDLVETGLPTGLYTAEQLQRSLNFDSSITRYIREKNGSEIYTDSKRSLQVRQDRNWVNFTDPAAPSTGDNSPSKNILSAIDFVNQHDGWSGKYRLEQSEGRDDDKHIVKFQQYYGTAQYGAFPILDTSTFHYGTITLEMRQGTITGYERSLLYIKEGTWFKKVVTLPGGKELREKIKRVSNEAFITNLYPAYLPSLSEEGLLLTPTWVVELSNGATRVLK